MSRPPLSPSGPTQRRTIRAAPDVWAEFERLHALWHASQAELMRQIVFRIIYISTPGGVEEVADTAPPHRPPSGPAPAM